MISWTGENGANGDMNQGVGGKYVYGFHRAGGLSPLDGIGIQSRDHWWEPYPQMPSEGGWFWKQGSNVDADLNDGAGGAYLTMIYHTKDNCRE
jgi:hypothetical protein